MRSCDTNGSGRIQIYGLSYVEYVVLRRCKFQAGCFEAVMLEGGIVMECEIGLGSLDWHRKLEWSFPVLVVLLEEGILRRLKGKEAELERTCCKNAELEKCLKQLSVASQIWQNVANNNENIANTPRENLEQVLV
ncbi:hypothetical protein SUGI_0238600 [Cryptomeria japonica]|nr:hypothetical protein SUGI_0238600 [Cryptomeria japonica]